MFQILTTAFFATAFCQSLLLVLPSNSTKLFDQTANFDLMSINDEPAETIEGTNNLSGYWRDSDNKIVHLTHNGSELIARHILPMTETSIENSKMEFRTTIIDNFAVGYLRRELAQEIHDECPQISKWVGLGLAINKDRSVLEGFRGYKTVTLDDCEITSSKLDTISYTKIPNYEDNSGF